MAAKDYGPSANNYTPTVALTLVLADSELEPAMCNAHNADPARIGAWVWAFSHHEGTSVLWPEQSALWYLCPFSGDPSGHNSSICPNDLWRSSGPTHQGASQ